MSDSTRRQILQLLAAAPVLAFGAAGVKAQEADLASDAPRTLVAYFTRTGNTRVIAGQIQRARAADLFEIAPATPYPVDYQQTVDQARQETLEGFRPPLRENVPDLARYDTIYLGFPIWGMTAPPVIRSFLAAHDTAGKTIVPFITHGGYGTGSSLDVLAEHAPQARIAEPFVLEADQERRTLEQVTGWLGTLTF